jgi:predicted nucleic acid-binding protein
MIVLDASVVVELLTQGALAEPIRNELAARNESLLVPHLIDVEAMSALRRLAVGLGLDAHTTRRFFAALEALPAVRYPHTALLRRVWELRHNFTAYDAVYIALAETTGSVLYTCDAKLGRGHRARVVVFAG